MEQLELLKNSHGIYEPTTEGPIENTSLNLFFELLVFDGIHIETLIKSIDDEEMVVLESNVCHLEKQDLEAQQEGSSSYQIYKHFYIILCLQEYFADYGKENYVRIPKSNFKNIITKWTQVLEAKPDRVLFSTILNRIVISF